ncbi:MAG: endonuclease [Flavobacteriaceae bacterium]
MNNNKGDKNLQRAMEMLELWEVNWYPGDEWKGDVARMVMYMILVTVTAVCLA